VKGKFAQALRADCLTDFNQNVEEIQNAYTEDQEVCYQVTQNVGHGQSDAHTGW
jgi:hypothetical protein